jgi:hypothetical protein
MDWTAVQRRVQAGEDGRTELGPADAPRMAASC